MASQTLLSPVTGDLQVLLKDTHSTILELPKGEERITILLNAALTATRRLSDFSFFLALVANGLSYHY